MSEEERKKWYTSQAQKCQQEVSLLVRGMSLPIHTCKKNTNE